MPPTRHMNTPGALKAWLPRPILGRKGRSFGPGTSVTAGGGGTSALEKGAILKGQSVTIPAGRDPGECWAYMSAVQDFAGTVEQEGGPSILGSCVPAVTTRLDIIRAFTKYARKHRSELDVRATAIIIQALAQAYPCRPAR